MKKPLFPSGIMSALLFLLFSTQSVQAYEYPPTIPVTLGQEIRFENGPGTTAGGEFEVYTWNSGIPGVHLFNSFCLETNEFLSYGAKYIVAGISEGAINGGVGGGNPDAIDPRTAYLYHNFYWGTLQGYDYGAGRDNSANALQNAIWYIENEISTLPADAKVYYDLAEQAVKDSWSGLYDVRAINLTDALGNKKQDQLTVAPVPEPATLFLLGSGVIGLFTFGKRRSWKLPFMK